MGRAVVLVQTSTEQAEPDLGITGPFSVEVPSGDDKLIRIAAVEAAMPQLLKRETFTVEHEESAVGKILPVMPVDWKRVPEDAAVQAMVKEFEAAYGGLPTAIVPVTEAIVGVFPRLAPMLGERIAWVSGTVHGDNRISQRVAEQVRAGKLNSFSLNGAKFGTRRVEWCDPQGCRFVEEVNEGGLDLETITLCSDRGEEGVFGATTAQNPGAALVIVQQAKRVRAGAERVIVSGIPVRVEIPAGGTRKGTNARGEKWERVLAHAYGSIPRTEGADGEAVDAYVGPDKDAPLVTVIHQVNQDTGAFDEHKVMLGFPTEVEARAAYAANYPAGWKVGPSKTLASADFQAWLKNGDTTEKMHMASEHVIIGHGPVNASSTVQEGRLQQGGCAAQAIARLLQAQPDGQIAHALTEAGRVAVADTIMQAAAGWLGKERQAWAQGLLQDPALAKAAIDARGMHFKDFAECQAWAERHGLKDPKAFCGALEHETKSATPASELVHEQVMEAEVLQLAEQTGVPAPVIAWLAQAADEFPGGFEGCVRSMSHRKGVANPEALCAYIGRKAGKIPAASESAGGPATMPDANRNTQAAKDRSPAEDSSMPQAAAATEPARQATPSPAGAAPVKQDAPAPGMGEEQEKGLLVQILRRLDALEAHMGAKPAAPPHAGTTEAQANMPGPAPAANEQTVKDEEKASGEKSKISGEAPAIQADKIAQAVADLVLPKLTAHVDQRLAQAGITTPTPAAPARVQQGSATPVPAPPGGGQDVGGDAAELDRLQQAIDTGKDPNAIRRGLRAALGGGA